MRTFAEQSRRGFLQLSSALAVSAAGWRPGFAWGAEPVLPTADRYIVGKDKRLLVHSTKTGEIETPLELLRDHAITPKSLLFVRNNQFLPETLTVEPAQADDWRVEMTGLAEPAKSITVGELSKLPQRDVELVLQCSGNSRSRFAQSVKAEGVPWKHGAMGNVVFRGVSLQDVLEHCRAKPARDARYVTAEGKDVPLMADTPDFEHSVPVRDALERTILALSMNDQPLPKVHGGPVRLITPGFYATMNVKWLSALRFESQESSNHHHVGRYRTPLRPIAPGSAFTSTLDNSEPNWNMRIKSVIFGPLEGATLGAGNVEVSGVAWNDGAAKIVSVEISTDGGQTWRRAELTRPGSPYAWHPWKIKVPLKAGAQTILSRANDALGRTQPMDGAIGWNPAGYAWNGVDAVSVTVQA